MVDGVLVLGVRQKRTGVKVVFDPLDRRQVMG